ncbi:MAG: arylsulfatase [Pseudomonadota bacterium]
MASPTFVYKLKPAFGLLLLTLLASCTSDTYEEAESEAQGKKPNFLIVVADDLGWSDLGAFGGEISTPNLDGLAQSGLQMTQFYVAPTCSPTRSMLMSGLDNHTAGLGTMHGLARPNQTTRNYAAQIHNDLVTVAEALSADGYSTMMSGKWHLAVDETQWPHRRGFDQSFTLLQGGASHFGDMLPINPVELPVYVENGNQVEQLPADFYSSVSYTDKLLSYLSKRDKDQPFFAYLAYTAPHDPLQVPVDWQDKYAGRYAEGPAAIQAARLARQRDLGLVGDETLPWPMPNFPPSLPLHSKPWESRSEAQRSADSRAMEIYAAMIELMDSQLGRVLDQLKTEGELENTYVLFFSDNGASTTAPLVYPGSSLEWLAEVWSQTHTAPGGPAAFAVQGREWANVSNTPHKLFKGQVAEGGIRSPFIVTGPGVAVGQKSNLLGHVSDITPTLLDLAGIDSNTAPIYAGKLQPQGTSLRGVWNDTASQGRDWFGTEFMGGKALRSGQWKITKMSPPAGSGQWELFNIDDDPSEITNLAETNPDVVAQLVAKYDQYVVENGVIHPEPEGQLSPRVLFGGPCDASCEQAFADFASQRRAPKGAKAPPSH